MSDLTGSRTLANLIEAFARESQANRRALWFAQEADVEGRPEAAALFRSVAESETGIAHGHLEYLIDIGDPISGEPIGETDDNLRASIAGEADAHDRIYPDFARVARDEGFGEIADWFDTVARAAKSHLDRLNDGLGHP